jgi:hypothetical protein
MENKNLHFSFDQNQLDKIVEKLERKEPQKVFNVDKLLNVIQIIVLVISGCWIFYKYKSHEELSNNLNIKFSQLQNENLVLQNKLHHEMDTYTFHLSQLDVQRASQDSMLKQVDIQYKEKLALIEYNSKKLDNESQSINLKYADALKKLEEEHNRFQVRNDSLSFKNRTNRKIETPYSFSVKKREILSSGTYLYEGTVNIKIRNVSDIDLKISGVVIELYLADFDLKPSEDINIRQNFIEFPPDIFHSSIFSSSVVGKTVKRLYVPTPEEERKQEEEIRRKKTVWVFIKNKSGYDGDSYGILNNKYSNYFDFENKDCHAGEFGTGLYHPNEQGGFSYTFYFESSENYIAGVSANFVLNDGKDIHDQYSFGFYKVLKYLEKDLNSGNLKGIENE